MRLVKSFSRLPDTLRRVNVNRAVVDVYHHAGFSAGWLADVLDKSVVDGHVRACARLAVVRRAPRRLDDRRVADLSAFGGNNHVRAVDLLCVEPDIGLCGCLECEKVILTVVPADVDFKSVRRLKAQRRQSALF